jgi:hypothetical protein
VLTKGTPFYKHWLFYTAVGGTLAAGGAIAAIATASKDTTTTDVPDSKGFILFTLP